MMFSVIIAGLVVIAAGAMIRRRAVEARKALPIAVDHDDRDPRRRG